MTGMLTVALRNRIQKVGAGAEFEFKLKNIRVNSSVRGCSGFIKNLENGKIVYVNTEPSVYGPFSQKVMYRAAKDFKDYTGERNQWGELADEQFIDDIVEELSHA